MRFLSFIGLILVSLLPLAAHAQTPISQEESTKYYMECKSRQVYQSFSRETQDAFCACTAAHMSQFLSKEDVSAMMSSNAAVARPAYNKMIIGVYAPCMEMPTYDHYNNTCLQNPETMKYGRPEAICSCMAGKIGSYMKTNGSQMLKAILERNPDITDPMAALLGDQEFTNFANAQLLSCLQ